MADLPIQGEMRDEIARILEQVAQEGLDHPRDLDSAIDAIGGAIQGELKEALGWFIIKGVF